MRRLVCAIVVPTAPKTDFLASRPNSTHVSYANFNIIVMSLNAIHKNEILVKIFDFFFRTLRAVSTMTRM